MSWRPETPQDKRRFVMPTFYGALADYLISAHWAAKDRDIQREHESFLRLAVLIDEGIWRLIPENDEEERVWQIVKKAAHEYRMWRTHSGVVEFVTRKDSKNYLQESSIYLSGVGDVQLAPDKASYFEMTGLPPVRYIGGQVGLDDLDGDVREWKAHVIRHTGGIRARIYECHHPDIDYLDCTYRCKGANGKCPYLVGPVYTKNLNRLDSGTWYKLRNMAHRELMLRESRMLKPLWDLISVHVSADALSALGEFMTGREYAGK